MSILAKGSVAHTDSKKRIATEGVTLLEMMMAFTITLILAAILLPVLARGRAAAERAHCMNNLRQLGQVFHMIAAEKNGAWPAGAANHAWGERGPTFDYRKLIRNNFICDGYAVYPDYLDNLRPFVCLASPQNDLFMRGEEGWWYGDLTFVGGYIDPVVAARNNLGLGYSAPSPDAECLTSQMYTYLPYAVATEAQGIYLFDRLHSLMYAGAVDFMRDNLAAQSGNAPGGGRQFLRLRAGVERFFITNINNPAASAKSESRIPVMFDSTSFNGRPGSNHLVPLGGNILFMDGHVEFRYLREPQEGRLPYAPDFMEWTRLNTYNNEPLLHVPPWCSNRTPGTPYEPRYRYYPNDSEYAGMAL